MLRGKWIAVSCWHLSLPGLAASSHAQDTSRCHLPALLQKPQSCSEPELLGHLNYVQQAWSLQQQNAVLPRQPTARASVSQSVLSLSSYFMWLQPLTTQAHAPHPAPTENGWHTNFRTVTNSPDSSRAGTHKQRSIFVFKLQEKHSPCQTNPAFSWLLSLYPSLLSQFKLQNHHAAQVEDGVQTPALLVLWYHTWSSCRHYKHIKCLWDASLRAALWRAASTTARFSLSFSVPLPLPSWLLALSGVGR